MLEGLRSVLAFLTIIPVRIEDHVDEAAEHIYLFPLVGALLGGMAGSFAWLAFQALPKLVVGMLTLGLLLLLTGLYHTDGLVDFGDGLAVWGSREEKIKAMRDEQVGVGGVSLGMVTLLVTALCMAELGAGCVLSALVVIEASAKLSMVTGAYAGRVACEGTGARFIRSMRKRGGVKFLVASATSLCIAALLGWVGLAIVVTSVLVSLIVVSVSNRHFGGVMGDGLGAMNDLSRMAALVVATGLL